MKPHWPMIIGRGPGQCMDDGRWAQLALFHIRQPNPDDFDAHDLPNVHWGCAKEIAKLRGKRHEPGRRARTSSLKA